MTLRYHSILTSLALLHQTNAQPNPCKGIADNSFNTVPGTGCKDYVQCLNEDATSQLSCAGDTVFDMTGQYCNWPTSVTCVDTEAPTPSPTPMPSEEPTTGMPSVTPSESPTGTTANASTNTTNTTAPAEENTLETVDCSTPCQPGKIGLYVWPNTQCKRYAQCDNGLIKKNFDCPGGTMFFEANGVCKTVVEDGAGDVDSPYTVQGTNLCPEVLCEDGTDINVTTATTPTLPPSPPTNETTIEVPVTIQYVPQPSTSPVLEPISIYENMRKYLFQRKGIMDAIVFQSQHGPSIEYSHQDMMNALNVAVYQLPIDLAFYGGENFELIGINYGLVNMAAMLANAMVEGIKTDSCDEWNKDDIDSENWKFPLSNSCGQYGRNYPGEICRDDVDSLCPIVKSMNLTAGSSPSSDSPAMKGPPPLTCGPTINKGSYVGYYDSVTDSVVESAFANSFGRTNIEGCCWWGRGALFTRGRCIMGKLNKYLGKRAADAGYNAPYKYIDFCSDPNVICESYVTRELRWMIAFLEWAEEVQSYVHIDAFGNKWTYWDRLASFVDGGMVDNSFIDQIINILLRKCHDGLCKNNEITFEEERKNNFRRIIGEVFNLPLAEDRVPDIKTRPPTNVPTPRPTRKRVVALPPSSANSWKSFCPFLITSALTSLLFV